MGRSLCGQVMVIIEGIVSGKRGRLQMEGFHVMFCEWGLTASVTLGTGAPAPCISKPDNITVFLLQVTSMRWYYSLSQPHSLTNTHTLHVSIPQLNSFQQWVQARDTNQGECVCVCVRERE